MEGNKKHKRKREDSKYIVFEQDFAKSHINRMTGFKTFEEAMQFYVRKYKTFNNEIEIEHLEDCGSCNGGNSSESELTDCEGPDFVRVVELDENNSYRFNFFPCNQSRVLEACSNDYNIFSIIELYI